MLSYPSLCVWEGDAFPSHLVQLGGAERHPDTAGFVVSVQKLCSSTWPSWEHPPSVFWGEEAVNKGSRKRRRLGPGLAGARLSAPDCHWPPLCSARWLRTLAPAFFWAASAPSVPGGGGFSCSRTWSSPFSHKTWVLRSLSWVCFADRGCQERTGNNHAGDGSLNPSEVVRLAPGASHSPLPSVCSEYRN